MRKSVPTQAEHLLADLVGRSERTEGTDVCACNKCLSALTAFRDDLKGRVQLSKRGVAGGIINQVGA